MAKERAAANADADWSAKIFMSADKYFERPPEKLTPTQRQMGYEKKAVEGDDGEEEVEGNSSALACCRPHRSGGKKELVRAPGAGLNGHTHKQPASQDSSFLVRRAPSFCSHRTVPLTPQSLDPSHGACLSLQTRQVVAWGRVGSRA